MASRSRGEAVAPLDAAAVDIFIGGKRVLVMRVCYSDCERHTKHSHSGCISPLCMRSIGWRCIADAARFDEFRPIDMASAGLRITGIELVSSMVVVQ